MMIIRFALTTCAFYLMIAALVEAALICVGYVLPGLSLHASRIGWAVFFGIVWLAAFTCSYRVLAPLLHQRFFSN